MMTVAYVIGGVILLFFAFQYVVIFKMRMSKGNPAPDLPGHLGKQIKKGERLLIYFFSPGCRACVPMGPIIDGLNSKSERVYKIDVSKDMATAKSFGIMGTPATVIVDKGHIAEFLVGAQKEEKLVNLLA